MSPLDPVLAERHGAVLLLTLNRPERLNAWTDEMEDLYFDLLADADADPDVRAIVVTGSGRGFCAGADMEVLSSVASKTTEELRRPRPKSFPLTIRKPIIGAVNGAAAGLGFVQAMYCDVILASSRAVFLTSFVRRGLIAEYGIAWVLPRRLGHGRASDLLLSGRKVDATEAAQIGLVDRLVEGDVVRAALDYAAELAEWCSPTSMAVIKRQLRDDATRGFDTAFSEADRLMLESFARPDLDEGVASFAERRSPEFAPLASAQDA
ncbi:enoyl-CoA hydratase-related protein [Nonomuraea sp. NPDC050783]|uniref:enoyl-CoA hydratase-related protein n=1 Tax=Nonomuraea sp. NPDC050783 TaxID=3154634 RepID=UPI003465C561